MSNVTEAAERLRRVNANIAAGTAGQISSVYGLETVASYETDKALLVEAMLAELSTAPITAELLTADGWSREYAKDYWTLGDDLISQHVMRDGTSYVASFRGWPATQVKTIGDVRTLQRRARLSRTSTHEGGG